MDNNIINPSFSSIRMMKLLLLVAVASPSLVSGQILGNLTAKCERDWNRYIAARGNSAQVWAQMMWDAQGKLRSGLYDGNMFFEGDYGVCKRVRERLFWPWEEPIKGQFCVGYWINDIGQKKGMGYCIPHTCTDEDAYWLYREVDVHFNQPPLKLPSVVYCIRDKDLSQDPGAIVAITILSLFGAIVLVATFVDVFCYSEPVKDSPPEKHSNKVRDNPVHGDTHPTTVGDNAGEDAEKIKVEPSAPPVANGVQQIGHIEMHNVNGLPYPPYGQHSGENVLVFRQNHASTPLPAEIDSKAIGSTEYCITQTDEPPKPKKPSIPIAMLLSFSLNRNVPRLLNFNPTPGSFQCLNGMRVISTFGVVWGHTYYIGLFGIAAPLASNRYSSVDMMYQTGIEFIHQMWLVVDTFFCMSGLLVTYSFMKMLSKKGKVSVRMMVMYYVHRYWRLTPVYMIVLMIYATLFHYFGNGPFMPQKYWGGYNCKNNWWQNLLYIQNLWPVESFTDCMGWSWYLNLDMQFYIMAPVFIITAFFFPVVGIPLMIAGYLGSVIAYLVIYSQLYDPDIKVVHYVDIYIKPWTRACTYFLGMLLGYVLFKTKDMKIKMHPVVVCLGWFFSLSLIWTCVYIPRLNKCDPVDDAAACGPWTTAGNVTWNSLISTMYIMGISWIIFACVKGYGGFINSLLSWNGWLPLARLSYTTYLIHYMVIEQFYYTMPKQLHQYHYGMQYQFCGHIVVSTGAALILSLVFEKPMLGLEKVLLPSK